MFKIFFIIPLIYLLVLSFSSIWRYPALFPETFDLNTWKYFFDINSGLIHSLLLSLIISSVVALLSTSFGFVIGKALAASENKNMLLKLSYFPYAFSPIIYAFCINFLFIKINFSGTLIGVVFAQFIISIPFAVILFCNHWSQELNDFEKVVLTLGGTKKQAFLKVILPLSKNILGICFFQTFLISWFEYGLTSVIGLGKIQTLTIKTYQFIGESNILYAGLASVLLIAPPLIILFYNRRFIFDKL